MSNIRAFPNYLLIALALILGLAFPLACQAQYFPSGGSSLPTAGAQNNLLTSDGTSFAAAQPDYSNRRIIWCNPANIGQTTFVFSGTAGSLTHNGTTLTASRSTNGIGVNSASGAVAGNDFGWQASSIACWGIENNFDFTATIQTDPTNATTSGIRQWVGLGSSAALFGQDAPGASQDIAAFRMNPGVDGTAFWRTVTCNNGGAATVTITTAAIATNTKYVLRVMSNGTNVFFFVNGTLVATHTTNLPGGTNGLTPLIGGETTDTTIKNMVLYRFCFASN